MVPDLITRQDDGTPKVVEIKTTSRAFSESEVATSLQPTCYASALHDLTGQGPLVEYTVLVKTKVPKVQRIEAIRTIPDFRRLGDIIAGRHHRGRGEGRTVRGLLPDRVAVELFVMSVLSRVPGVDRAGEFEVRGVRRLRPRGGRPMLAEMNGKAGTLCSEARNGAIRCPLIVRPTSEDVITAGGSPTC